MPINGVASYRFQFGAANAVYSMAERRHGKCPGRSHRPGHVHQHLVGADVHETQTAPGLDVPVAIAADIEGRAAIEAPEAATPMPAVMATMATVHTMATVAAMTAVATMAAS
jgi:hypothetical protein